MAALSISSVLYEESKMPDHHKILDRNNLFAAEKKNCGLDVYGTSTALNILTLDGKIEQKMELEDVIRNKSQKIRNTLSAILDEDDAEFEKGYDSYVKNSLLNIKNLCFARFTNIILLPHTVSVDTFNTCYPFYRQLEIMNKNYTDEDMYEKVEKKQEEDEKSLTATNRVDSFFSLFSSVKKKPEEIIYKQACMTYINAIKHFLRMFLNNDDYLINSYIYFTQFLKNQYDYERIDDFYEHINDTTIQTLCYKVFADVRKLYKVKYTFDEVVENGLKYKIIPENFIFYRSYPSSNPPFPKSRPQVWVGFTYIDTVGYGTPESSHFDEDEKRGRQKMKKTSINYCQLLGNVSTFRLKKELKLIDIGSVETIENLMKILQRKNNTKVLKALETGWKIIEEKGNKRIQRESEYEADSIFADWLYESGYDGYIGYGLQGLHDECCISRDKSLEHIEEPILGMGLKFPLELLDSLPIKQIIPLCNEPFSKINYDLTFI